MKLLKELAGNDVVSLRQSDGSDAGSTDVINKAKSGSEIGFSLMRNTINSNGQITGSEVANYLERAAELNDEIDTIAFGLETDDGDIVKVYVNAEQADAFAEKLKQLLGVEDDIEEAINTLALDFDIVDVVWPKNRDGEDDETDNPLDLDGDFDALSDDDEDEEFETIGEYDDLDKIQDVK